MDFKIEKEKWVWKEVEFRMHTKFFMGMGYLDVHPYSLLIHFHFVPTWTFSDND